MGSELSVMNQERDLDVTVDASRNTADHCAAAAKKANSMIGIRGSRILTLYCPCTMVLLHFVSCVQFWFPHLKDTEELGNCKRGQPKRSEGQNTYLVFGSFFPQIEKGH